MASTEGLAAISRHILTDYYNEHPLRPPLSDDVFRLSSQIQSMAFDLILLNDCTASQDEKVLMEEVKSEPVYEIERNLWKNREHLGEILCLIGDSSRQLPRLQQHSASEDCELARVVCKMEDMFQESLDKLVSFQDLISERIFNTVTTRLPRITRGTLIKRLKEQEIIGKTRVDDLVASGASIGAHCALLWEQEMDRRRPLAKSCNTIHLLRVQEEHNGRIPKDVLRKLSTIDNDEWPMEEQKEHYGPPLYRLTAMVLSFRLFLSLLWGRFEASKLKQDDVIFLDQAVDVYTCEFQRFIAFISEVFTGSPFFQSYKFEEINIAAGETHEVSLEVDAINSNIAWDFRLFLPNIFQNKIIDMDIEFSVEFTDDSGNKSIILPKKRCHGADIGSFVAVRAGNYKLIWDNSYTLYLTNFLLRKVECTPPILVEE